MSLSSSTWSLCLHGGAGAINRSIDESRSQYLAELTRILNMGAQLLSCGRSSEEVCVACVRELEDCPLFNAGHGAVLTRDGTHELDASIMVGSDVRCGAVTNVRHVKNPIVAAQLVMNHSQHTFMAGDGAEAFIKQFNVDLVDNSYFTTTERAEQWRLAKQSDSNKITLDHDSQPNSVSTHNSSNNTPNTSNTSSSSHPLPSNPPFQSIDVSRGTVGCVALDQSGVVCAATSTGGMNMKLPGRIGDTPIIGGGTYANNATCAVSCTGWGEMIMRTVLAYDVSCLMEHRALSLHDAAQLAIKRAEEKLPNMFSGGLIAVDNKGNVAMPFNSAGMYRGCVTSQAPTPYVRVWED